MIKLNVMALIGALALAACSTQQTANTVTTVDAICKAAAPLTAVAQQSAAGEGVVADVGKYLAAACTVDGKVADGLKGKVEPSTPEWLVTTINLFAAAAQVAAPMLPALISVL